MLTREDLEAILAGLRAERQEGLAVARRERIAVVVMGGLAADPNMFSPADAAATAVQWADALIAELDRRGPARAET